MANNTIVIQILNAIGVIHTMESIKNPTSFDSLYESMENCKHNVIWKNSVAYYSLHGVEETIKLKNNLDNGLYKMKKPKRFVITSKKPREICSIAFRDRVYQRSLNDNVLYPIMTNSFINSNCACQKGKGTDYARNLLNEYLHRFYRKHKLNGYVLQCDIKGYYPNMKHEHAEELFKKKLPKDIYRMVEEILHEQYPDDIGYNPGSQMIQILGISMLDSLDHFVKEKLKIKLYIRYMDDFILIHEDRQYLEYCRDEISRKLAEIDFELHPTKTRIYELNKGIKYLGFTHRLTDTGKVLMLVDPKNVKRERKKLYKMVKLAKDGKLTKEKVDECYKSWIAHISKGNSYKLIQRMNKYYKELWQ